MRGRRWPRLLAAGVVGLALGAGSLSAGALLLYGGRGFLSSAGSLIAVTLASTAAGLWVGAPDGPAPGHRRVMGRWTFAIAALVIASFVSTFWLQSPALQTTSWAAPLVLVLLLAEPAYAMGALLAGLEARRRAWLGERWYAQRTAGRTGVARDPGGGPGREGQRGRGGGRAAGVAVPAVLGAALGTAMAASWLIPAYPPGPVFLGLALLLAGVGSLEMALTTDPREGAMSDRVVIVTGVGDRGQVGYAVAEAFVERGARVLVTSRGEAIHELARSLGGDVVGVPADLADPEEAAAVLEAARSRWGRLDVLVNVAGGLHVMKSVEETSPEEWRREIESNAGTAFVASRAALPLLRQARGVIVNFASPAALRGGAGMAAYSAGKAGVVALTRALAREEREAGVRVNAVAPGMVDTAQNREGVADPADVEWVTREQVVDVVLFLASDAGSGVNGETVRVPGRSV